MHPEQDMDPVRDREPLARVAREDEERARQAPLREHRQHIAMVVVVAVIEGRAGPHPAAAAVRPTSAAATSGQPTMVAFRDRSSRCAANVSRFTRPAPTRRARRPADVVIHEHRGVRPAWRRPLLTAATLGHRLETWPDARHVRLRCWSRQDPGVRQVAPG